MQQLLQSVMLWKKEKAIREETPTILGKNWMGFSMAQNPKQYSKNLSGGTSGTNWNMKTMENAFKTQQTRSRPQSRINENLGRKNTSLFLFSCYSHLFSHSRFSPLQGLDLMKDYEPAETIVLTDLCYSLNICISHLFRPRISGEFINISGCLLTQDYHKWLGVFCNWKNTYLREPCLCL